MRKRGKENCFPELHNHHFTVIRLALHPERFGFDIGPPIFGNPPFRVIHKKYGLSFIQSLHVVFKKVTTYHRSFQKALFYCLMEIICQTQDASKEYDKSRRSARRGFQFPKQNDLLKVMRLLKKHLNPTPIKTYVAKNLQTRQLQFFAIRKDKRFGDLIITCIR